MNYEPTITFARKLDQQDPLKKFRSRFLLPRHNGKAAIYLCGNSLGPLPKATKSFLLQELEDWGKLGVDGHVHARRPWLEYHKLAKRTLSKITGAKPLEVIAMNQLTVNLHLLLVSFFRPTGKRFKILTEAGAFSSDQYVFESQLKFHGYNSKEGLIELRPREGEFCLRTEDIISAIKRHADEIALVLFGAVQYYTGQFFDLKAITAAAHQAGAYAGFDLAHAVGNVVLNLHDDDVDFAAWCSYKYLNSGPGAVAGAFVHERHAHNTGLPRFSGWWGHDEKERFLMKKEFHAMPGVDGWQLSNHPVLLGAAHLASLKIIEEAGMKRLRKKSEQLTGYLEFLLNSVDPGHDTFEQITPKDSKERGCQLSLYMKRDGKKIFKRLSTSGVIADWREPNVIRLAPAPLYNTFEEVFRFGEVFARAVGS
jgi:kynureninase